MAPTNREPPSYEELEPEGDASWGASAPLGDGAFEDDEYDEFMMGPLGEYELEDAEDAPVPRELEDIPGDELDGLPYYERDELEYLDRGRHQRPRSTLPARAARAAFRWSSAARTARAFAGNGRHPRASKAALGAALGRASACSAGMAEAQELMDAMAVAAAAARDESEALGLGAAMVPVSLSLVPNAYRALWPAIPALVRGAMGVIRLLHREPSTRPQIRILPKILQGTTAQLARHAARGSAIRQELVAKVLADHTAAALSRDRAPVRSARRSRGSRSRPYDPY